MYPLHDKDLDRLSREAAEHFEAESGASGWANLEKRLDVELPQKKKKRRFLFWLFFITATTGGALIGIMKYQSVTPLAKNAPGVVLRSDNSNNTTSQPSSQTATDPQPVSGAATPVAESSAATTQPVAGNDQPAPAAGVSTVPDNNTTTPVTPVDKPGKTTTKPPATNKNNTNKSKLSLNYASVTLDNSGTSSALVTKNPKRKPGKKQKTTAGEHKQTVKQGNKSTLQPDTRVADNDQQVNTNQPDQAAGQSAAQQATTAPAPDPVKQDRTTAAAATDSAKTTPVVKKEPEKKQDKKVKGLELGLMTGPDLSTVKFGPVYKTGYNFGVQVGYRFSNRWSVNTGVIYTKKFYKADSADFHYKTNWPNYKLRNVEGNCAMWEIPVNVRYDVSFNEKRRWFVSTGLSTYLMDKEDYVLYYGNNWNNYIMETSVNNDVNSNYIFSIVNLSAGMERSFGKRFSLQAEPYLKVPLKGLGMGSMRMTSYGVLFTLKYKPQFNSKRSDNRK